MTRYRAIHCKIWNHRPFVDDDTMLVMFHLLTSPLTNRIGMFNASIGMLSAEMEWDSTRYRVAFERLPKGFVYHDEKRRLFYLPGWISHNPPNNPNVLKGWANEYNEIPDCSMKAVWFQDIGRHVSGMADAFKKAFTKAFQKPKSLPERLSTSISIRNRKEEQTPRGISSLKDEIETEFDKISDNEIQVESGQVDDFGRKGTAARIVPILQELWPDLTVILAEQYYTRIRSAHPTLGADTLEKIIRIAWSKWPVERSIYQGAGIGAWIVNEIGYYLRDEKREAERRGDGSSKPDVNKGMEWLAKKLEMGKGDSTVFLSMERVQSVVNEAVADGIELPRIVISWLDKGAKNEAFELGPGRKLLTYHRSSGAVRELIAAPPAPMDDYELSETIAKAKDELGITPQEEAPESTETAGKDDTTQAPGELNSEERRVLEEARNRNKGRAAAFANYPENVNDILKTINTTPRKGEK